MADTEVALSVPTPTKEVNAMSEVTSEAKELPNHDGTPNGTLSEHDEEVQEPMDTTGSPVDDAKGNPDTEKPASPSNEAQNQNVTAKPDPLDADTPKKSESPPASPDAAKEEEKEKDTKTPVENEKEPESDDDDEPLNPPKPSVAASEKPSAAEDAEDEESKPSSSSAEKPKARVRKPRSHKVKEREASNEEPDSREHTPEPKTPLLDIPLEVHGKRQRKSVDRLKAPDIMSPKEKEFVIPKGSGTAFRDIPYIFDKIAKNTPDDLKVLHRLCFSRSGKATVVRKNLRLFCGFEFEKDSQEYLRKRETVTKMKPPHLKKCLEVTGVERTGVPTERAERLMTFMVKPYDMGKRVIDKKRKASKGSKSPGSQKQAKKSSKGKSKAKAQAETGDDVDDAGSDAASDSDSSSASDSDDEAKGKESSGSDADSDEPKLKKSKKETPAKKTSSKKRTKETPKSSSKSSTKEHKEHKEKESPGAVKSPKAKKEPSDADLRKTVEGILKDADLEQVTMKTVCKQVYDTYPHVDLVHKKDFIKETVRSIIAPEAK